MIPRIIFFFSDFMPSSCIRISDFIFMIVMFVAVDHSTPKVSMVGTNGRGLMPSLWFAFGK